MKIISIIFFVFTISFTYALLESVYKQYRDERKMTKENNKKAVKK